MRCVICDVKEAVVGNYCLDCDPGDDDERGVLHRWDSSIEEATEDEPEAENESGGETDER